LAQAYETAYQLVSIGKFEFPVVRLRRPQANVNFQFPIFGNFGIGPRELFDFA
jgi:hypothetical protein